jgi:hypothetical protein
MTDPLLVDQLSVTTSGIEFSNQVAVTFTQILECSCTLGTPDVPSMLNVSFIYNILHHRSKRETVKHFSFAVLSTSPNVIN